LVPGGTRSTNPIDNRVTEEALQLKPFTTNAFRVKKRREIITFKLNVSGLTPYKKMGASCQLENIAEFQILWPKLTTASNLSKKRS
jgi:hypothetical protein